MKDLLFKGLTQEQIEKAKSCKSIEDLLACAQQEGLELTEEQLSAVSGGGCNDDDNDKKTGPRKKES